MVEVVVLKDKEEAEKSTFLVCTRIDHTVTAPGVGALKDTCSKCQTPVWVAPNMPVKPTRICHTCARVMMESDDSPVIAVSEKGAQNPDLPKAVAKLKFARLFNEIMPKLVADEKGEARDPEDIVLILSSLLIGVIAFGIKCAEIQPGSEDAGKMAVIIMDPILDNIKEFITAFDEGKTPFGEVKPDLKN